MRLSFQCWRRLGEPSLFEVNYKGWAGRFSTACAGRHNVLNATAAVRSGAAGSCLRTRLQWLEVFSGVDRGSVEGCSRGVTGGGCYGHHPTEISATLRAVGSVG